MFKFSEYDIKNYRISIILVISVLNLLGGYIMQYVQEAEDKLFEKHIIGLIAGLILIIFVSMVDYHFVCRFYLVMYVVNFILLAMVKYSRFGGMHFSAKRWLRFPDGSYSSVEAWFEVQPSELTKVLLILFLAKLFVTAHKSINKWYFIVISGLLVLIPVYFIFTQPDLSTSVVLLIVFMVMLYYGGISYKIIGLAILIGIPLIFLLNWYIHQPFQKLLDPYQLERILALENPELYTDDEMWQQNNAAVAIRSGGMSGKAFTEGLENLASKNVPAAESDFIFSTIAESFGFIGSCILSALFGYLIFRCISIARHARDRLGALIAVGTATMLMVQFFFNVGVATSLLPNTGLPLPYVSSGTSSLLSNLIIMGININIDLQHKKTEEKETMIQIIKA